MPGDIHNNWGPCWCGGYDVHPVFANSDDTDIAWAAGFFDGEGCIRVSKDKRAYRLLITVRQVDIRPIEKLVKIFGGKYFHTERSNKNLANARPIYTWHLPGKQAVPVLKKLLPHLVNKREQAEIAIRFQESIKPLGTYGYRKPRLTDEERAFREECLLKLQELKWQR